MDTRRRVIASALGVAAAGIATPLRPQQRLPVVTILSPSSIETTPVLDAFRSRLAELGHVEGRTIRLDFRLAKGRPELIRELAVSAVKGSPDLILGDGSLAVRALKDATLDVPIIGLLGPDPVLDGLVASLARPGGNVTGVTLLGLDLHPKRIELLRSVVPKVDVLAVLRDPSADPRGIVMQAMLTYAKQVGLRLDVIEGGAADNIAVGLSPQRLSACDAVLVTAGPSHFNRRQDIVARLLASGKPAMHPEREYVVLGGMMSYGPNVVELFRRLGEYADRILKGARPADLPVEQAARFEFVLNLKTLKALNLTVGPSILARADELIQ